MTGALLVNGKHEQSPMTGANGDAGPQGGGNAALNGPCTPFRGPGPARRPPIGTPAEA